MESKGERTMDRMQTRAAAGQQRDATPRAEGSVLWLLPAAWENDLELRAQESPIPMENWIAETTKGGYTVQWMPESTIDDGPYAGGIVVGATALSSHHYFAVPPELVGRLAEVMPAVEYQRVRDDLDELHGRDINGATGAETPADNSSFKPVKVLWIDAAAWTDRGAVVPVHAPIPTDEWARVIRDGAMRVALPAHPRGLSDTTPCPGGVVVTVDDDEGRRYFAVPRAAWGVARDLATETADTRGVGAERREGGV